MENNLKLIKVNNVEIKKIDNENREYVRITFEGFFNGGDEEIIKSSISLNQWKDLKKVMDISFNSENSEITTKNILFLKFDPLAKTKSKNPKLLVENKKGIYKGYDFNYWELSVGVLIQNGIVQKGVIKKDFSNLF